MYLVSTLRVPGMYQVVGTNQNKSIFNILCPCRYLVSSRQVFNKYKVTRYFLSKQLIQINFVFVKQLDSMDQADLSTVWTEDCVSQMTDNPFTFMDLQNM